ncbi:MAG: integration host factor subunit alpha [Rhodospirillaceae bacterium]|nr:integration host factor subunit alpha [Rhodospirillaceae bacterium]
MATVTRANLTDAVHREIGLARRDAAELLDTVIEAIAVRLEGREDVKISSFGSFTVRDKGLRAGRNPKTGEPVPILPRRVVVFRASAILKQRISRAMSGSGDGP